jgi:hypothetical protein
VKQLSKVSIASSCLRLPSKYEIQVNLLYAVVVPAAVISCMTGQRVNVTDYSYSSVSPAERNDSLHFICIVHTGRPPLWSNSHSSWLQIRRPGFDSRHYEKKMLWVWNGVHLA